MNTVGSFRCECSLGHSVKDGGGPGCTDDDECLLGTDLCSIYATCVNTPGSYSCQCADGYRGNGRQCTGTSYMYMHVLTTLLCRSFSAAPIINLLAVLVVTVAE